MYQQPPPQPPGWGPPQGYPPPGYPPQGYGPPVLSARGFLRVLAGRERGDLAAYVAAIPGNDTGFSLAAKLRFRLPHNNALADGYPAEMLAEACIRYTTAFAAGRLRANQMPLAVRAMAVVNACCKAGITALVWEATGYDKIKAAGALNAKFNFALRAEAAKWKLLFHSEFFLALAQLFRLELDGTGHRPACFGAFLAEFFYEWFDKDVLDELRRRRALRGPIGKGNNHHQHLTDTVRERFEKHRDDVLLLIKSSESLPDFRNRFNRAFRGGWLQLSLYGAAA